MLWHLLVGDNSELAEEGSLLFPVESHLQLIHDYLHSLQLLNVYVELDSTDCLAMLDVLDLQIAVFGSNCQDYKLDHHE